MKVEDIEKIQAAGLISEEQRDKIIAHFKLKSGEGKFLAILSLIGAVLIGAGVILLISAHWNEVPRGVKIFFGVALMLGLHGGGWWLREVKGTYRKTGEALHLAGSAMFLANIALIGQIYNLSSRPPNAILLWVAGIAALPWILRSKAQFISFLIAFTVWFGMEINEGGSLIYFSDRAQLFIFAMLGLIFYGAGNWLRQTSYEKFSGAAEKLGILALLGSAWPLTWRFFWDWGRYKGVYQDGTCLWLLPVMAVTGILLSATGILKAVPLNRQWKWTWAIVLAVAAGLLARIFYMPYEGWSRYSYYYHDFLVPSAFASIALFAFCLVLIQVGLQLRSRFMVNIGVLFIALTIITAYFSLFGTMMRTGLAFTISGVFLIVFGVFLEKRRRKLIRQIKKSKEAQ